MSFYHKGKLLKSAALFGLGKSNSAVFEYLRKAYPDLKITVRSQKPIRNAPSGVEFFEGERAFEDFCEDVVFVSPSVRRDKKEFSDKLLSSDAELFFEKNERAVFAVTGSDGKSTTTAIAKELLATSGKCSYAVGNIGVPFTTALDYPENSLLAAELSSFQLMDFSPKTKRAVITNITPNHLDWHVSFDEYISAKENVLKNTEEPVFFLDDDLSFELSKKYEPYAIASKELSENEIKSYKSQTYVYIKNDAIYANGELLLDLTELLRSEEYNIKNFLSAIALTYGYFDKSKLSAIAKSFSGLSHRFEYVIEIAGVKFFNSSIDTSPKRTLASLSSYNGRYVLIMGGRTKMKNFEILRDTIEKNAHALVLTGENRHEIYEALKPISTPVYIEKSLEACVEISFLLAKNNCDIIFSPASTSYDAFEDFEKRGEAFKLAARRLYQRI